MLLSFILYTTTIETEYLIYWLETIFKEKRNDFEVVIIDDNIDNNDNLKVFSEYFKLYPQQLKFITNYQICGIATSRNLGLKYASGKYVVVLNPTEIPATDFVNKIKSLLTSNDIDCLEYRVYYEFNNKFIFHSTIRTEVDEIYKLNTLKGKNAYALTTPLLATKIMKLSIIKTYNIQFRKEIHFDSLFLYSFLAHCNTYYAIIDTLINCKSNLVASDNAFELMNQWIHILNYYNNNHIKKALYQELEYAFIRYYLYTFLKFISLTKKPALIEKVYNRVKETIEMKFKNFRDNPYLKNINKYDLFTTYAVNLSSYFKNYFLENNIKDDSKYWE